MDQSELLNLGAVIGTLTYCITVHGNLHTFEGKFLYTNKLAQPNKLTPLHGILHRNDIVVTCVASMKYCLSLGVRKTLK